MDEAVLKKVCKFLKKQKDNEAVFQVFWEGTKEYYPSDLSKTKVKAWLKEHPERFEIIKSETGNPVGKIKLKVEAPSHVLPPTTKAENREITQKLIECIDNKGENGHLFGNICKNKARIFPEKLQNKKHIRKWLEEHENWFKVVKDASGGLHSVEVVDGARHLKNPPGTSKLSRGKATPQKAKDETDSDVLLKLADDIERRISEKINNEGGTIPFESLLRVKDVIYPLSDEEALINFLRAFPLKFDIIDLEGVGKWVHLKGTNNYGINNAIANDAISKVISFIFQNGGTVPFANLVKETGTLIGDTVNGPNALSTWLNANANAFEIVPKPDDPTKPWQIKVKLGISPRFCQNYVTSGQCPRKKCQFLHICKAYVCQRPHGECKLSHDIRDAHNKVIVDKMGALSKETDAVVINVLLKSYFPRVCSDYNKNGVCPRGDKCHFLHVCGDYVLNQCENHSCLLSHNVVDGLHNIDLLKKYALLPSQKLSVDVIKANIAFSQINKSQSSQGPEVRLDKSEARHTTRMKATNLPADQNAKGCERKNRRHPRRRRKKSGQASSTVDDGSSEETDSSAGDSTANSSHNYAIPSLLSSENIQKGNLAIPLTGHQKVDNWMGIPTVDTNKEPDPVSFQPRKDSISSSEISYISHQSSVVSSQSSIWQDDLQKKVFITILEKYNGDAPFKKISKDKELFGCDINAVTWFENHTQKFILHRNGQGKIDSVSVFSRKSRICLDYSGKRGCGKPKCGFLHLCRDHIEGHCRKGKACCLNHDVSSDQVTQATNRMGLQDLTPQQLLALIQVSVPAVCHFYNQGHCNRGDFCPKLHLCKAFVKGHRLCKAKACKFGHEQALKKGPATKILKMYHLYGKEPNFSYIRKMIFVFETRKQSIGSQHSGGEHSDKLGDVQGNMQGEVQGKPRASGELRSLMDIDLTPDTPVQESQEETPNICPKFVTGKCRKKKKCLDVHFALPYCWQLSSSPGSWCSFEKTDCENIEKYFCDVNCTAAELNITTKLTGNASTSVRLDFQSMSGHPQPSTGQHFKIRRLECRRIIPDGSEVWCETGWMWYELESSRWIEYETNKASVFEELFLKGNLTIDWSTCRRRPAAFLTESEVDEKKRGSQQEQTTPAALTTPTTPESPISSEPLALEPGRENIVSSVETCHCTRVEPGSLEYKEIEKHLGSSIGPDSLVINQLETIVSDDLWKKYKSKKISMTDELRPGECLNDRNLFIPCYNEDIERIMKGNVCDSRMILHNEPYGPGYYFTSSASLCIQWCNREHLDLSRISLIVCQVLLGTYTQGSRGLKEFPRRPDGRFYDSLVDNKDDPSVFVIKNVDQCYPAFVIEFSYTATPGNVEDAMPRDSGNAGHDRTLTVTPPHNFSQLDAPTYQHVPLVNHPLSPEYVPQSTSTSLGVLQQQPLSPNTSSRPPDYVKAVPQYSDIHAPTSDPPPTYTPYPQPTPANVTRVGETSRSSRDSSRDKKDCLVM